MLHPQLRTTYVLAGPLRWVEADGKRAVLRVDAAGGRARRFCGRSVTLDLDRSRIAPLEGTGEPELRAGQMVTVRARLPRHLEDLPSVVAPTAVFTMGPLT